MAAAVADFRPAAPAATKLKKDRGAPQIELEPTEDVLSALAAGRRPGQVLVGFAAEHGEGAVAYGREKLERKGLDAIVVNDISRAGIGFDAADNEVTILTAAGRRAARRAGQEGCTSPTPSSTRSSSCRAAGKESNDRAVRADPVSAARV